MASELIKVEEKHEGQITEVVIGPPPANIVTAKMMSELKEVLVQTRKQKQKKLIVLGGTGKHFSFGASVEEHRAEVVRDMLPRFHELVGDMLACEIPILTKVSGMCLGGAFEVALAGTFIFADETAAFGVPEIQLAVFPPVANILLPLLCAGPAAAQVILTGDRFGAKELHSWGLVNHVAEKGKLDEAVEEFVTKQILPKSASSLRITCQAMRKWYADIYRDRIQEMEKLYLDQLMATKDAVEGIQSFVEKRKPQWSNE
jgi:cyclohexa-1,5-dienecarbonyl-CoA hydratase